MINNLEPGTETVCREASAHDTIEAGFLLRASMAISLKRIADALEAQKPKIADAKNDQLFLGVGIDELHLSTRARGCLLNGGMITIGDVERASDAELLRIPNFGHLSLTEVRAAVELTRRRWADRRESFK